MPVLSRRAPLLLLVGCSFGGRDPSLTQIDPPLLCDAAGPVAVTLSGQDLSAAVTGALTDDPALHTPAVTLRLVADLRGEPVEPVERALSAVEWVSDATINATIDAADGLEPGLYDVIVTRADGREATLAEGLLVVGPPALSAVDPGAACHDDESVTATITGEDLLILGGQLPTVAVGAYAVTPLGASGCAPLPGGFDGERCSGLTVEIPASSLPLGEAAIALANPAPAQCAAAAPAAVQIAGPPTLAAASPASACADGGAIIVEGSGFTGGEAATVGGVAATAVALDSEHLQITLAADTPDGVQPLVVTSAAGCEVALPDAVRVVAFPLPFFVDPPLVPAGLALDATAHIADLTGEISDLWLEEVTTGALVEVDWQSHPESGTATLSLPADVPPGTYAVGLVQDEGCGGLSGAVLTVTGDASVAVSSVDPPFAWTFDRTPVEIRAADPLPAGSVGFAATPQVYLLGPAPGSAVTPLTAVTWRAEDRLSALIPEMDVGTYDVLVINPDGAAGMLAGGVEVTAEPPPEIEAVTPPSLSRSHDEEIRIQGRDFRDPIVELTCLAGDAETTAPAEVLSAEYGEILALAPTTGFDPSVCTVSVTNADGASARWAALSITNPASNLFPWQVAPSLVQARRAPAAAAGRTDAVSRYVYAIGGDDGAESGASDTIEVAAVGVYGEVGEWSLLPTALPAPRTLAAAARIGRFLYLVGGHDGAGPVATVLRAQILDPLDAPYVLAASALTGSEGLGEGAWSYRISALFDASDAGNPGGESLASAPFTLSLPPLDEPLHLTLTWAPVEGAVGYRVYRSPVADSGVDSEEWLADVYGAEQITDAGDPTEPGLLPLPEGALGMWAEMPEMPRARAGACVAIGYDPQPDPEIAYLYAAGGLDESGAPTDAIDYLDIRIASDDVQIPGGWTTAAASLEPARHQCAGYVVSDDLHSVMSEGESWIYFAGGLDEDGKATGDVQAGWIAAGGELTDWQAIDAFSPTRAGFASAAASDFLYAFGGKQGGPDSGGFSAELTEDDFPGVHNWNSLGSALSQPRYLPGSAQESAIIFVIGGQTDAEAASRIVDVTNY